MWTQNKESARFLPSYLLTTGFNKVSDQVSDSNLAIAQNILNSPTNFKVSIEKDKREGAHFCLPFLFA
jgi:hypothetical protein